MPFYHKLGKIPQKRHTQFRQPDGSLYSEQLVGTLGFSGVSSLLYHITPPTIIDRIGEPEPFSYKKAPDSHKLAPTHLRTIQEKITGTDYLNARKTMLFNSDVAISICNPSEHEMDYYYKNGTSDEVVFVHEGSGQLLSQMGSIDIRPGDYVVIPRTIIHKFRFDDGPVRLLVIESHSPIETPRRYRNHFGQLLEHSPFCERDMRAPDKLITESEKGEYLVKTKKEGYLHNYYYKNSPFDVVGWDGFFFPYAFSIHDFEPITGRIHQPPPVHQTFEANNFVICSFVPRLYDYHPLAIPAPYNHSNVDSDEVLYYVDGQFMSRKGIDIASFTVHPGGIPHGPHPGTVEASIGKKETHELAVMIDTFKPLYQTEEALAYRDENYPMSWKESGPDTPRAADMMD